MDIQTLAYLKSYVNKVAGITDAFKYKGEAPINVGNPPGARTNWNDLAPCYIGDVYMLTGTPIGRCMIDYMVYNTNDFIVITNNVTVSPEGTVSENVSAKKIGNSSFLGNTYSIEDYDQWGDGRSVKLRTTIGGWLNTSEDTTTVGNMFYFTTDENGEFDQDVDQNTSLIEEIINSGKLTKSAHVNFAFTNTNTNKLEYGVGLGMVTKSATAIKSETNSSFSLFSDAPYPIFFDVSYTNNKYVGHLKIHNVSNGLQLQSNTRYKLMIIIKTFIYHPMNSRYLDLDETSITCVNPVDRNIGKIHAKSAIAVSALSTITSPLVETIYRLTAQEVIGGVTYNPGLYVYDISGASPAWIGVGGASSGVSDVKIDGTSIVTGSVANIPTANQNNAGVVKVIGGTYGIEYDGGLKVINPTAAEIDSRAAGRKAINSAMLDYAVKAAMCDGVGTAWTTTEQSAAMDRIGCPKDIQINETSIVSSGIANIPVANSANYGVVKTNSTKGINLSGAGYIMLVRPTDTNITQRVREDYSGYGAITTDKFDFTVKVAMCDGVGAAWTTTEQLAARNRMNAAAKEYEILASHTIVEGEEYSFTISLPTDTTNNHICIFMYNTECVTGTSSSGGYHFDVTTDSGIVSCYLNTYSGTDRKMIYTNIDKIDSVNNIWLCSSHSQMNGYGTTLEVNSYRLLNGTTIRSLTFVAADPNKYNVGTQIYVYKTK